MNDFPVNVAFSERINQVLSLPSPLQKLEDTLFTANGFKSFCETR